MANSFGTPEFEPDTAMDALKSAIDRHADDHTDWLGRVGSARKRMESQRRQLEDLERSRAMEIRRAMERQRQVGRELSAAAARARKQHTDPDAVMHDLREAIDHSQVWGGKR